MITVSVFLSVTLRAQQPKLMLPLGHTGEISYAQFSPDDKKVITASGDNTVKLWDAATGYLLANFNHPIGFLQYARFSPSGKKIIVHCNTSKYHLDDDLMIFKVWNAVTGDSVSLPEIHNPFMKTVPVYNADDSKLAILTDSLRIWNGQHKIIFTVQGNSASISSALFSPDDKWLLTVHKDHTLKIWNAANGKAVKTLKGLSAPAFDFSFNTGANEFSVSSENETITWNTALWIVKKIIKGKIGRPDAAAVLPNRKNMITAGYDPADRFVKLWNTSTRKLVYKIQGTKMHEETDNIFEGDGFLYGTVAAASDNVIAAVLNTRKYTDLSLGMNNDRTVKLYSVLNGKVNDSLVGHTDAISFIQFSRSGKKIITASNDRTAKIWDAASGNLLINLGGHTFNSRDVAISPSGKQIVTASDDGTIKLWDINTGVLQKSFSGNIGEVFSVRFSADGKKIISGSMIGTINIFEIETGKRIPLVANRAVYPDPTSDEPENDRVTGMIPPELSADGTKAIGAIHTRDLSVFDAITGATLFKLPASHFRRLYFAHFSNDGKKIIAGWIPEHPGEKDSTVTVWETETGKLLFKIKQTGADIYNAVFSKDDQTLLTFSNETSKRFASWDAITGNQLDAYNAGNAYSYIFSISNDMSKFLMANVFDSILVYSTSGKSITGLKGNRTFSFATFSPDAKTIATLALKDGGELWNAETGELISRLQGHTDDLNTLRFSPDGKKIITTSKDNTCKLWETATGNCLYTFFAIDSTDYFNLLPSGYYQGTVNAAKKLHYVTGDLNAISFEQLDVKYNRPDKVLIAAGNTDTVLLKSYKKAYEKRITRIGIDTSLFNDTYSMPLADIVNADSISYEQRKNELVMRIKASDAISQLRRFNVWINEVPLYGMKGLRIERMNRKNFDTTISVPLSAGENRIEISVTNSSGADSYRKPVIVNYTPPVKPAATTWFIGIGINNFANKEYNLKWCVQDIRDLAKSLEKKFPTQFIILDTLFDEKVTPENIKVLKQKLYRTGVNDKLIISYSGHGLLSKDLDYYLSAYNTSFDNPETGGVSYDEFENLLDSIPVRKKILFIDACHSGELDKEDIRQINASEKSLADKSVIINAGNKGGVVTVEEKPSSVGLKNSFELMQTLFVNVGKGTGATIISASGGVQFAQERSDLGHGVFTYSLIEVMKKYSTIKISALKKYIGERVTELTNGLQVPTSRSELVSVDWDVW